MKKISKSDHVWPIYERLKLFTCADDVIRHNLAMSGAAGAADYTKFFSTSNFIFVRGILVPNFRLIPCLIGQLQGVGHIDLPPVLEGEIGGEGRSNNSTMLLIHAFWTHRHRRLVL